MVFNREIFNIFKNNFFLEHLQVTASGNRIIKNLSLPWHFFCTFTN